MNELFAPEKLSETVFCAIDLETTGINPFSDRIIEVGIIRFTLEKTLEEYQTLVDPGMEIPRESFYIHGITDLMVKGKPTIDKVLDDIRRLMKDAVLIIQNPLFDISFLEMEFRRCGQKITFTSAYDTVVIARRAFPGLINYKLDTVSRYLNIQLKHHRAFSDASACMQIFLRSLAAIEGGWEWNIRQLENLAGPVIRGTVIEELTHKRCPGTTLYPGRDFMIDYVDSSGIATRRKIKTMTIFRRGKQTLIHAFCHMRNEERFFISSRIKMAYTI